MGRIRTTVAAALDGVIGGLATVRDAVAGADGDPGGTTDRAAGGAEDDAPATGDAGDAVVANSDRDDSADGSGTADLETADGTIDLAVSDGNGLADAVRERVGTGYEYQKTALRHPIAAQRAHLSALRETPVLSTDFLAEAFVATESAKRDRVERIRRQLDADRTIRDDARDLAGTVDWTRTWEYGKYGFLVGSRYRKRLPVGDAYAPVAGAVAGGAVGAVAGATDRTLVDVDPDRLFDRIDAVSRLRDDPVARAQVTRETLRALDRRVGNDDLPVERLFEDDLLADIVTREDEAVPDSVPGSPRTRAAIDELIWGDPLSDPSDGTGTRSLPPANRDRSSGGSLEENIGEDPGELTGGADPAEFTEGEDSDDPIGDDASGTSADRERDRSTSTE